jgi:hypothetical protein
MTEARSSEPGTRPAVLLVGDGAHAEFTACVDWLRDHTELTVIVSIPEVLSRLSDEPPCWDVVILAQSRPGQLTLKSVEQLTRTLPLTPFVALLGSCCEGETRSGKPWPGVMRLFWHQWLARVPGEMQGGDVPATWHLPKTSSDAERVDYALRSRPARSQGLIVICTPDALFFQALDVACRTVGYETTWLRDPTEDGPANGQAVLWHCTGAEDQTFSQIREARKRWCRGPLVALCGFPRYDQVQRARACGAAAVVSLPFLLPDLWNILRSITEPGRNCCS